MKYLIIALLVITIASCKHEADPKLCLWAEKNLVDGTFVIDNRSYTADSYEDFMFSLAVVGVMAHRDLQQSGWTQERMVTFVACYMREALKDWGNQQIVWNGNIPVDVLNPPPHGKYRGGN